MDGKFVMELPLWLLLCMMEERMPSSNAFSPEMLFPPDVFSPGEGMLNCQKSFHQRKVDDAIWAADNALMEQLKLNPQLQTFQAWLWDSATVSIHSLPGLRTIKVLRVCVRCLN
ncbi:protein SET DOMAIN GROUP 40-like isoform X1 [Pyrus communis]|uniref:protein SET DOMAIN GROUP 40-like isoform X1 n=1 Tax=Pyrus communis TaxID=23211 RepID=UPI0035C1884A